MVDVYNTFTCNTIPLDCEFSISTDAIPTKNHHENLPLNLLSSHELPGESEGLLHKI